jgi:hypothetical protein
MAVVSASATANANDDGALLLLLRGMEKAAVKATYLRLLAMYEWFGDRRTLARMCDTLSRALRVPYGVMDFVYETRLELICPHACFFPSFDAYIATTRDALVKARRAYECEAEACESALRTRRRAELQRQQARAVAAARRLPPIFLPKSILPDHLGITFTNDTHTMTTIVDSFTISSSSR